MKGTDGQADAPPGHRPRMHLAAEVREVFQRCSRRGFLARSASLAGALYIGQVLPTRAQSRLAERPLILVHGFADQVSTWQRPDNAIVGRLLQAGYDWDTPRLSGFAFPASPAWPDVEDSQGDIATAGVELARTIQRLASQSADGQVDLLGFSMGGLVSRWAINSLRDSSPGRALVNRAVFIATPNDGADILLLLSKLNQRSQATIRDLAREVAGLDLDSIGARQMLPRSEFLDQLNQPALADDRVSYTTIAGAAELYVRAGPLNTRVGVGDGVLSAASAAHLPGVPTRGFVVPETLGADGEPPWQAIRRSTVYHPLLLFNDQVAVVATSELAPSSAALQQTVAALLDQGGVRLANRT